MGEWVSEWVGGRRCWPPLEKLFVGRDGMSGLGGWVGGWVDEEKKSCLFWGRERVGC